MKRFILSMAIMLTVAMSAMAMNYEQAKERALFLTDKMAYELNLTDEQYEAAYEVNLDYLMSINSYDDLYGTYWTRRNLDLSYILLDWQYSTFCSAAYFYRPLVWDNGIWRFSIYARYPHRTYFYFGRPSFYMSYRGGHSWNMNGGRSWYHGRSFGPKAGESRFGMRDKFDRGDFNGSRNHSGNYNRNDRNNGRFDRNNGGSNRNDNGNRGNGNFSGYRGNATGSTPSRGTGSSASGQNNRNNNGGFSGNRGNSTTRNTDLTRQSRMSGEFTTRQSSTRETVTRSSNTSRMEKANSSLPSRSTGSSSFGSSSSRPASTFTPSKSSSNLGSALRSGSSSKNSGSSVSSSSSRSTGSFSGSGRSGGGGHFGGKR